MIGINYQKQKSKLIIHINFEDTEIQEKIIESKYDFMPAEISNYICVLSDELQLDSDLVVAILMNENPTFNAEATNRNKNGTTDCGLFQLNDRYIWTDFVPDYWFDIGVEFNPYNWKHNTFIALHHIQYLSDKLKVFDDVVMAYNCGIGAVMNNNVPEITKIYLSKVKNNFNLLKNRGVQ
jgi:hypothetical protein